MILSITNLLKRYWKFIVCGVAPVALVAIIFAIPVKTVPVQTAETYWTTEIKQEPYTVKETYTDVESYVAVETARDTVYNSVVNPSNWTYSFVVDEPQSNVCISLQSGYMNYTYPPIWYWPTDNGTRILRFLPYEYLGGNQTRIKIDVSYPREVTKYRNVTKTRDVVKYREVPTQVLKERIVTTYVRKSIWAYLFS